MAPAASAAASDAAPPEALPLANLRRAVQILALAAGGLAAAGVHRLLARWPRWAGRLAGPRVGGPRRLRAFFERSGGAFIKLGQLLALQPDILPRRYCNELYDLLDRVEPCPFADIEAVFAAEIGRTPDEAFDRFDRTPLSTASIGQVHVAWREGRKYAVKVRRAGADAAFARDLRLMDGFLRLLRLLPVRRFYWLESPISEFLDWTSEELDYRQEARYMEEIRRNATADPRVVVPAVEWELTSRRTLVMEYCEGTPVLAVLRAFESGDADLLAELAGRGFDAATVARHVVDVFLRDAFLHGIFHADLHPANLLILPDNAIGYVDFGITGALSVTNRRRLAGLTLAWSRGDLDELTAICADLSAAATAAQRRAYRERLDELATDWYGAAGSRRRMNKSFTLVMVEMLAVSHRVGMMPDRSVTRYLRSATALDGLLKRLSPDLDIAAELESGCRRHLATLTRRDFFSFGHAARWAALPAALLGPQTPPPAGPAAAGGGGTGGRSTGVRALRLAVVAVTLAALATLDLATGDPSTPWLAASIGTSFAAALLAAGTLAGAGAP